MLTRSTGLLSFTTRLLVRIGWRLGRPRSRLKLKLRLRLRLRLRLKIRIGPAYKNLLQITRFN